MGDRELTALLPGEQPPEPGHFAAPVFLGYSVAVRDLTATQQLLMPHFPLQQTGWGASFVPSSAALGATIAFLNAGEVFTE